MMAYKSISQVKIIFFLKSNKYWSYPQILKVFKFIFIYWREKIKNLYKKYLGPDWTADYEKCGSIVSNHSSWMDILIHMLRKQPSHVSEASVRKIPGVGKIAEAVGCLFLDRGDNN